MAAFIRLLYAGLPLTADEGGYATLARLWARGAELYDEAWVDRPQGLMIVFRAITAISPTAEALRLAAIAIAMAIVVLVALVGRKVTGDRPTRYAVLLVATAGASPFIESFTLSGELIASLFSVGSMLAFVVYLERRALPYVLLAGVLTGCAVMVKQSAFDAGLAGLAFLLWNDRRAARRLNAPVLMLVGILVPVGVAALFAPDFGNWWHAVVTYRSEGDSLFTDPRLYHLGLFVIGVRAAGVALLVPVMLVVGGWGKAPLLLRLWLLAGLLGVAGGGNFWPHYWIQIVPPLCLIAGVRLSELLDNDHRSRGQLLPLVVAVSLWLVATLTPALALGDDARLRTVLPGERMRVYDARIVSYVETHSAPGARVLVTPLPGGTINFLADRPPAYRYLWFRPAAAVPGAIPELQEVLIRARPALVVELASPDLLDPSGRASSILASDYRVVERIGPAQILEPIPRAR